MVDAEKGAIVVKGSLPGKPGAVAGWGRAGCGQCRASAAWLMLAKGRYAFCGRKLFETWFMGSVSPVP